jgi:hypothetical protein
MVLETHICCPITDVWFYRRVLAFWFAEKREIVDHAPHERLDYRPSCHHRRPHSPAWRCVATRGDPGRSFAGLAPNERLRSGTSGQQLPETSESVAVWASQGRAVEAEAYEGRKRALDSRRKSNPLASRCTEKLSFRSKE